MLLVENFVRRKRRITLGAALCLILGTAPAVAQQSLEEGISPQTSPTPLPVVPPPPAKPKASPEPGTLPQSTLPQNTLAQGSLRLEAVFASDKKPIRSGLTWRVYPDTQNTDLTNPILRSTDATPAFQLEPGAYIVHVAYGFASAVKRVTLAASNPVSERLAISAGGLELKATIGEVPIPAAKVSFSIYLPVGEDLEGRLIAENVHASEMIRLPDGLYHVVSTYGDTNAILRTDVKVDPGKVTQATLRHRAATVTLKLVASEGGEAFAGTAFSVLTPGGDVIREAIGAFPQFILAEGEYVVIARYDGQVYTREFKVESGVDRDVDVLVKAVAKKTGL